MGQANGLVELLEKIDVFDDMFDEEDMFDIDMVDRYRDTLSEIDRQTFDIIHPSFDLASYPIYTKTLTLIGYFLIVV